jgi:hypothetical protein
MIGAEVARLDASREDVPQRSIALSDPFHHGLDCLGDAPPGSFPLAGDSARQIEHVKSNAGMTQQMG